MTAHKSSSRSVKLSRIRRHAALAALASMISVPTVQGATQTWIDANANNNWNTTDLNWDAGAAWTQTNDAIFGGTGEIVSLTAPISVGNITFNSTGYTLSGNTLTLGGATPTISNGAGINATISSVLAGTAGLIKTGNGTLTLSGANTFTGTLNVSGGTLTSSALSTATGSFLGGVGTSGSRRVVNIDSGAQVSYTNGAANGFLALTGVIGTGGYGAFYDFNISGTLAINDAGAISQILHSTYNLSNGGVITTTGLEHTGAYGLLFGWSTGGGGNINVTGTGNQITADRIGFFNGATINTNAGADLTITSIIKNGAGTASSLTKAGTGTLILTGANTYTGNTTINGGELKFATAANQTLVGTVTGAGALTQAGNGMLTLSSATVTHAGATTVARGVLNITNATATTSTAWNIGVDYGATAPSATGLLIFNKSQNLTGKTLSTFTAPGAPATTTAFLSPLLALQGGNTGTLGVTTPTDPNQSIIRLGNTYFLTHATLDSYVWSNAATGAATDGAGTWDAATTASWRTTSGSPGTNVVWGGGSNVANFGVANGAAGTVTVNGTVNVGGLTFNPAGSGSYTLANGASGQIDFGANNGTVVTNGTDATIAVGLAGSNGLTKLGSGTLTLNGASAIAGPVLLSAGGLTLGHASALGTGTLTINEATSLNSSVVNLVNAGNNAQVWNGNFTFTGTQSLDLGTGPVSLGTAAGTARSVTVANNTLTIGGVISNGTTATGLTKNGAGTLVLAGTNTYTGATIVNGGVLSLNANAPTILGDFIMNGQDGTYTRMQKANQFGPGVVASFPTASGVWNRFDMNANSQTLAGITTGDASTQGGGVIQVIETGTAGSATLTLNGSGNYLYNGHLRNGGTGNMLSLTKSGSGTQTLIGNQIVYTGATNITNGHLIVSLTGAMGTNSITIDGSATGGTAKLTHFANNNNFIPGAIPISVTSGTFAFGDNFVISRSAGLTLTNATLDSGTATGGNNATFGAWLATANQTITANGASFITGSNKTIGLNAANNVTFATPLVTDVLTVSGTIVQVTTGTGGIGKSGAGTMILSGANTYTGATQVTGGTLTLSGAAGAIGSTTAVTIANGATLKLDNTGSNLGTRLNDAATIALNGGTLQFANDAAASTNYSEAIGVVTAANGATISTSQAASGQNSTLTLGGLNGLANFSGLGLGVDNRNKVIITGKANAAMVGSYNNTGLALYDTTAGSVVEASYTPVPFAGTILDGPSSNIRLTGGSSGNVVLDTPATVTVNTILQNQISATVIDNASKVLRVGAAGGVLLPAGMASLSIGIAPDSGTLTADSAAGTLNLANNDGTSLLTVNSVVANNIGGVTNVVTGGAGKVVLAGVNTYTGTTFLGAATTEFSGGSQTLSGNLSGAGNLLKSGSGTLTLTGAANTNTGASTINGGTLQFGNGTTNNSNMSGTYTLDAAGTLRWLRANDTVAPTWANISGSGLLSLMTNRANSGAINDWGQASLPTGFTGTLQIERGRVSTNGAVSLGNATAVVVASGGHLGMWPGGTFPQNFTIAGTGYGEAGYESALRLANPGITTTVNGTVTLSANATIGATGTGILNNEISGAFSPTFGTSNQAGTVVLNGTNTYTGATTVAFGTLLFGKQVALYGNNQSSWTATNLVVNANATAAFNVGGTGEFSTADINLLKTLGTATGGFKSGSLLGFDTTNASGGDFAYAPVIGNTNNGSNALGVNKLGIGTLTLSGANTYAGVTRITGGTLSVDLLAKGGLASNIGLSSSAASSLVFAGGNLKYTGATATTDHAFTLSAAGGIEVTNPATVLTIANDATTAGNSQILTKTGNGTLVLGGSADNSAMFLAVSSGEVRLDKSGNGVRAAAGITGVATGATVKLTGVGTDQIFGGSAAANFGVNGLAGTLDLNGHSESTSNVNGSATGVVTNSAAGTNAVFTVGETDATSTFAGSIQNGAGTVTLTKIGAGTITLSGASTHTGGTFINAGTLNLAGTDSVGGTLTLNGGTLSLDYGASNTSKTAGALVLNSGTLQLTGATGNHTEVVGSVAIHAGVNLIRNGVNTAKIALGNFTNNGVLNVAGTGLATTTVANNASGYLNGVTFNGNEFAKNDGAGNIVAATGITYNDFTRLSSGAKIITAPTVAGAITRLTEGTGTAANITIAAGTTDIGTLFQTATGGATTVDLTGGILRLAANGRIISAGANSALTIQNGTLTAGGAPSTEGTIDIRNGSTNALTISSTIADNGAAVGLRAAGSLVVSGAGNSYTGATTVVSGTTTFSTSALATTSGYSLGDVSANGADATLRVTGAFTSNRGGIGSTTLRDISPITVAANGAGISTLDIDSTTATWVNGLVTINKAVTLKSTGGGARAGFMTFSGSGAGAGNDSVIYDATGSGNDNNWNTYEPVGTYANQPNTFLGNVRFTGGTTNIQNKQYGSATAINLVIPDTASVKIDNGSTANFVHGNESFDGLNDGVGGGGTLTSSAGTNTNVITIGANGGNGAFSGVITSGIGITKAGAGTQVLSGANTYTGVTTISGGTLRIGNGGTTGTLGSGAVTNNAALVFDRSNNFTVNNAVSGSGTLTKTGAGTMTLTGASTYTGATTISGGTLQLGGATTLPTSSAIWLDATDGTTITTGAGGVTGWTNKGTLGALGNVSALTGQEPSLVASEAAMNGKAVIRFDASNNTGAQASFDRLTNAIDFSGTPTTIMYAGRLYDDAATGTAYFRLVSATNNFLLGTWSNGMHRAHFVNGFVDGGAVAVDNNAHVWGATISPGVSSAFYGDSILRGTSTTSTVGPNGLALGGGFGTGEFSDGDIGEMLVFTRILSEDERAAVDAYLSRKWRATNTTNLLPTNTAVSLTTSGTKLDVNGVTQTIGSIAGVTGTDIALGGGSLATGGDNSSTTFDGALSGAGTVTKQGSGNWILGGNSTNTGNILVNGGTLTVNGSLTGSNVTVATGATLGGAGSITGDVLAQSGATLSPGNSPGQLDTGNLNLNIGATLLMEIGGTTAGSQYDQLNVSGSVTLGGNLSLALVNGFTPAPGQMFWLTLNDTNLDAVSGFFSNVPITDGGTNSGTLTAAGQDWLVYYGANFDTTSNVGGNDILLTAVPEPGAATALLLGLGAVAGMRRRRRSN